MVSTVNWSACIKVAFCEAIEGMESNGSRVSGRTINNLRFADDIGLMAELLDIPSR